METAPKTDARPRRRWPWLVLAAAALAVGAWLVHRHGLPDALRDLRWADIQAAVRAAGAWGPALCIVLLAVCTVSVLSTTPIVVLAGLLYGLPAALAICWTGLGIGMALAFLLSRTLLRAPLERRYGDHPLHLRIRRHLDRDGWKLVVFLRMLPVNPFPLLNYLFGLTPISFRAYILASLAGVIPNILFLLLAARAAGNAAATGRLDLRSALCLLAAALLFAALAFLPRLLRRNHDA